MSTGAGSWKILRCPCFLKCSGADTQGNAEQPAPDAVHLTWDRVAEHNLTTESCAEQLARETVGPVPGEMLSVGFVSPIPGLETHRISSTKKHALFVFAGRVEERPFPKSAKKHGVVSSTVVTKSITLSIPGR